MNLTNTQINLSNLSSEEINAAFDKTIEWCKTVEKLDMNRMTLQLDLCRQIISSWHSGRANVIVNAPTGIGKSIVAFVVSRFLTIVSGQVNKTGSSFILTSNKFLQNQYQDDIQEFRLKDYAMLKGQANYQCTDNKLSFVERSCIDESISQVAKGFTKWKCSYECPYIQARIKAINANTTCFNYSYWLTIQNNAGPGTVFPPRELTIFDECHMLGNIVQDMFTFEFNITTFIRRMMNAKLVIRNRLGLPQDLRWLQYQRIVDICQQLNENQDNYPVAYDILTELNKELTSHKDEYYSYVSELLLSMPTDDDGNKIKTPEEKSMMQWFQSMLNIIQSIGDLLTTYSELGKETMVVQFLSADPTKTKVIEDFGQAAMFVIKLQCTNESELVKKAVLQHTHYALFMSATIGNIDDWAAQSGITDYEAIDVPQVFNYDRSPIFNVVPAISMSFREKAQNMPKMIARILYIVEQHPGERGLIHTGNFEIMKEIQKRNHHRILTYSNSAQKEDIIKLLQSRPDAIVCGPSLVEGISLDDDLCRFMIFAKVPYMSLADKLTKRKMSLYKNWYNWCTLSSILQGLGRPVRNNKDWCITYLLDSEFTTFFQRYKPPYYLKNRLKITKQESLGVVYDPDAEFMNSLNMK